MRGMRAAPNPFSRDRKSTRLNSSHLVISYAVFCLKKNDETDHPVAASGQELTEFLVPADQLCAQAADQQQRHRAGIAERLVFELDPVRISTRHLVHATNPP